jgi:flavin reductase (DIM6/NTAB) family NADH-FMN oxidoreductase RutF
LKTTDQNRPLASALGRIPSGLFILSARRDDTETGMLVSWVQQCSFEPPQITVALQRGRAIHEWLRDAADFTLNILHESQTDMVAHFGRGFLRGNTAFEGLEVDRTAGMAPVLSEALAFLDCRVVARCAAGDHELLIAEVKDGRLLGEGHPMVHVRKNGLHY